MQDLYTTELDRSIPKSAGAADRALKRGLAWIIFAVVLTACGGSGGGSGDDDDGDSTAPTAKILFPPAAGVTDADNITVTGTAADAGTVTVVRVNGVDATSSDGFASWRAVVPLAPGANDLVVETGDQAGNMDMNAASASLLNQPMYKSPIDLEQDIAGNRLLMADRLTRSLLGLDLADGSREKISGYDDAPSFPRAMTFDAAGNRIIVAGSNRLHSVDPATGDYSVLSDGSNGMPFFGNDIRSITYDDSLGAGMERILTAEGSEGRIFAVDLATGDRTVLSVNGDGKGGDFVLPVSIVADPANNRALVADGNFPNLDIIAVDLTTGNRTVVSPNIGTIGLFTDLALDAANERLYAISGNAIVEIDLQAGMTFGDSATLSDDMNGAGPDFAGLSAITMDTLADRLLAADDVLDAVVAVDPASGDRTIVDDNGFGVGEAFSSIREVELDPETDHAYVYDQAAKIIRVELDSGARSILTDDSDGKDNQLTGVAGGIGIDLENNQLLVATANPFNAVGRLVGVDLATGDRTEIASPSPAAHEARAVIRDTTANRAITAIFTPNNPRLNQIDLASGVDTVFSGSFGGTTYGGGGDFIFSPITGMALDAAGGRVLVMYAFTPSFRLIEVDLASGDRNLLLQAANAPGDNTLGKFGLDTARNRILMVDRRNELVNRPGLVYTDLDDNSHGIFADPATSSGIDLTTPQDIAIHPGRDLAVVLDTGLRGLVAVDLESGDRVLFSK
jgi:hypothetical protein